MAQPKKLDNGKWVIQCCYVDQYGKKHRPRFYGKTKYECFEFEQRLKSLGVFEDITVEEAIRQYINNKSNVLSPSTVKSYEINLRNHYKYIRNKKLSALTSADVQKEINLESNKLSPKSLRNIYGLLCSAVKAFCPDKMLVFDYPAKIKAEINIPSKDEIQALVDNAPNEAVKAGIMLAAYMGLRRSEICALTWNDIDFDNMRLSVNKAVVMDNNNIYVTKTTKTTGSTRVLDIPDIILSVLSSLPQNTNTALNLLPHNLSDGFYTATRRTKIKCRFHDLRHYYASVMLMLGVPDKYAMERMGHSSNNMLKTVYQHTFSDKQAQITSVLNSYFNENK
jgi:integrase